MAPVLGNPNWFAYVALLAWPLVALWLFRTLPLNRAVIWTILGGYLLLPVHAPIKIEMIPTFDKISIPNMSAFAGCLLIQRRSPRLWNRFGLIEVLIVIYLVGPLVSSVLNGDVISVGQVVLPSVGLYDGFSAMEYQFIFFIPFLLGRQLLNNLEDNYEILRALVIAGLLYSIPMLFETRMSPQLHYWIYGLYPHAFYQQVRGSGFRPVVFTEHGLAVAFFAMTAMVAAAALWRANTRVVRIPPGGVTAYLGAVLVLCKSAGPLLYGLVLVPLVRFANPRLQVRIAMVLAVLALLYPLFRAVEIVPTKLMVELAATSFSAERAASLKTRFDEERQLMARASERLLFGWGRFGRSRIYDPDTGEDLVKTDGYWIGEIGDFGLFGFLAVFGLFVVTVFHAASALKFATSPREQLLLAALTLMVAISLVDLIPNAFLSPWIWLLVGALLGRSEALRAASVKRLEAYSFSSVKTTDRSAYLPKG
jgi:hypothetical protein